MGEQGFTMVLDCVSKCYGWRGDAYALRDVNLTIEPGVFGLLGRNGAGKTTLLEILATLLDTTNGTVRIGPYNARKDRWAIRRVLGYLPQEQGFYPSLTVEQTLRYLATLRALNPVGPAVHRALAAVHLVDRARSRVGTLSGGMRRRLGLAQALLGDPPVVIVDEPTAGLDPLEQQRFRTLLGTLGAQGNRTILLSTHVVADVATVAQRLAVLEEGRLIFHGGVRDLAEQARGRTWQWPTTLNEVEATRTRGDTIVTALAPIDDVDKHLVVARVVGAQPAPEATPREPTLEDGYFALVGRLDGNENNSECRHERRSARKHRRFSRP